jgi:hypothetical protein
MRILDVYVTYDKKEGAKTPSFLSRGESSTKRFFVAFLLKRKKNFIEVYRTIKVCYNIR